MWHHTWETPTEHLLSTLFQCAVPALASDTALEIALEEMALFRFMISSNSASLRGARDGSISLHRLHKGTRMHITAIYAWVYI